MSGKAINLLLCGFLVFITGCSKTLNLQVESQVPTPLASRLPLSLGVYYNDNFLNYVFTEKSEAREDWTIDSRTSRVNLFNELLPSMFSSVDEIDNLNISGHNIDIIIEPDVLDMQVALPEETHSDIFEAWIKYGIKIYKPGGDLITEWQLTGYGKTHTAMFKNKESGLNTAINLALRDLGAKIILDFQNVPEVETWLATKIDCSQHPNIC
jgi:hypothetical protein